LVIDTSKGLVVITGCAHPGIVNIVRKAKEYLNEDVYMVIGGFHLGGANDRALRGIINDFRTLDVKKAGPCHCSGDRCRQLFKEEYGDDFIEVGVGMVINL
jgi:7,8-dihydropterin-6-yl-methyl-4-(beta-D-ribofuranosyl)aminobenzene 5'-phosphate synthase